LGVIAAIDSHTEVAKLSRFAARLDELGVEWSDVDSGVAVTGGGLLRMIDASMFTGFDAVWLFDRSTPKMPPGNLPLTSDVPLEQPPPPELVEWMRRHGCLAGLGDGDGLNVVSLDAAVTAALQGPRS